MSKVELLGKTRVWHEDNWHLIPNDKRGALLTYLAVQDNWVTRDTLAFIFWPDTDTKTAKANLRQILRRTKLLPFATELESDGPQLRWQVETDLASFQKACVDSNWFVATEAYNGHLLQDFIVPEASGFTAWLELERSELQQLWQQAVEQASDALAKTDRHAQAATLVKKVWQLDSFDEHVLRSYMTQAALAGYTDTALKVYTSFEALLETEMQLEPLEETQALAEQIKLGDFPTDPDSKTESGKSLAQISTTNFVGREKDITELKAALTSNQQIFALLGLGGVGKSRLALEVGQQLITEFEHGVNFVPLTSAIADTILSTIAEALRFSFYGNQDPKTQLFDYLRNKEMLLILDNFEHLTEYVDVLVELAQEAPKLKLLITSREKPDIAKLWTHQVEGLAHDANNSPALQLFLDTATVQAPSFKADDTDLELIQELCQVVEGLPLALELAAAWVSELSTQEILNDIKRNLNSLQHDGNSIDAVLEHSWSLLSPEQQSTLAKLSVFQSGFTKDAAQDIADTSNYLTLSLLNRSLIRQQQNRYNIHEMVRQFAAQKLIKNGTASETLLKHTLFFTGLIEQQQTSILSAKQLEALNIISPDIDNIRVAWTSAIESQENLSIALFDTVGTYYAIKSLFYEGEARFKAASKSLDEAGFVQLSKLWQATFLHRQGLDKDAIPLLEGLLESEFKARAQMLLGAVLSKIQNFQDSEKHLQASLKQFKKQKEGQNQNWHLLQNLNHLGNLEFYKGNYPKALIQYQQALDLAKPNNDLWQLSQTLTNLGTVKDLTGNYPEAEALHKESLSLKEALGDEDGKAVCYLNLGTVKYIQGDYTEAQPLFKHSLTIFQELGNQSREANTRNNLVAIRFALQQFDEAKQELVKLCDIYESLDNKIGLAKSYSNLGLIEKRQDNPSEALRLQKKSLAISESIGNQAGIITAQSGIAFALVSLEDYEAAWHAFIEGLKIANAVDAKPRVLDLMGGFADLLIKLEQLEQALSLVYLIIEHPAVLSATKDRVQKNITKLEIDLDTKVENIQIPSYDVALKNIFTSTPPLVKS